jgi:hypothetical protein
MITAWIMGIRSLLLKADKLDKVRAGTGLAMVQAAIKAVGAGTSTVRV